MRTIKVNKISLKQANQLLEHGIQVELVSNTPQPAPFAAYTYNQAIRIKEAPRKVKRPKLHNHGVSCHVTHVEDTHTEHNPKVKAKARKVHCNKCNLVIA